MRSLIPAALIVSSLALLGPGAGLVRATDEDGGERKAEKQSKVEGAEREKAAAKKPAAEGDEVRYDKKTGKPLKGELSDDGSAKKFAKKDGGGAEKKGVKFTKEGSPDGGRKFVKVAAPDGQQKIAFKKGAADKFAGSDGNPEQMARAMAELRERRERDLGQLREAEQKIREAYAIRENVLRNQAKRGDAGMEKAKFQKQPSGDEPRPAREGEKGSPKAEGEPRSGRDVERASLEQEAKRLQQRMMEAQMQHETRMRELQQQMKAEQERMQAMMAEMQQAQKNMEARARSLQE